MNHEVVEGDLRRELSGGHVFKVKNILEWKSGAKTVFARGTLRLWSGPMESFVEKFEPCEAANG